MKRFFPLSAFAFLSVLTHSNATLVSFAGGPTTLSVVTSAATPLLSGDLVWIGTFSNPSNFSFNPSNTIAQNIASIESSGGWNQFSLDTATGTVNSGVTVSGGINGNHRLSLSVNDTSTGVTKADFFNGKVIYVWIFDASTTTAADQMGIFTAGVSATTAWVFPSNQATPPNNQVQVTTDPSATPNMLAVGGAGSVNSGSSLQLVAGAPAPEPSTLAAFFGGAGLLAMGRRRRRITV